MFKQFSNEHAVLGPSAADRWMTCTASVGYIEQLAEKGIINPGESSVWADEGTAAHEVREMCLRFGVDPDQFIGMTVHVNGADYVVDEEMADALQTGIDWIREFDQIPDVEIRVDLSPWLPDQFGTMDAGWIEETTLYVSDEKYGKGEPVSAENNKQQMLYGLGYWNWRGRPTIDKVCINIDQPRAGGMKYWDTDFSVLLDFAEEVKARYAELVSGNVSFNPSKKGCRWCPARDPKPRKGYLGCDAYNIWQSNMIGMEFEDLDAEEIALPDPIQFSAEKRWYVVQHAAEIRKWLASMHDASLDAAVNGTADPGSKAVLGQKGNRYFKKPQRAERIMRLALGDAAYKPRQTIGIPDAEKLMKPGTKKAGHPREWALLEMLVDQPDGKPILVPADDLRPAVRGMAFDFDDLDETANTPN